MQVARPAACGDAGGDGVAGGWDRGPGSGVLEVMIGPVWGDGGDGGGYGCVWF